MSHGVTVDVVKFSAQFDNNPRTKEVYVTLAGKLCEPECYKEYNEEQEEEIEPGPTDCLNPESGWFYTGWDKVGKKKRIYAHIWQKENYKVFCWNCSQYNNVGEVEPIVASDDEESIKEFIKDFSDRLTFSEVEENEAVEHWS